MNRWQRGRATGAPWGRQAGAAMMAQLALLLCAGAAWASGGEGSAHPWMDLLWKTINFIVLLALLWVFARKPIAGMVRGAAEAAHSALAGERERARSAEADLTEQRRRIDALQSELASMVAATREEARSEHDRLLNEARVQAERITAAVGMQVEQEFNKARKELQQEVAQQTVRLAEGLIRDRMDDRARERIVAQSIEQMGAAR